MRGEERDRGDAAVDLGVEPKAALGRDRFGLVRAVLRAGSYELEHRKDVPGRVVVSEYVDVAHAFVDGDETGMVNAVLDQIARQFRADEFVRG